MLQDGDNDIWYLKSVHLSKFTGMIQYVYTTPVSRHKTNIIISTKFQFSGARDSCFLGKVVVLDQVIQVKYLLMADLIFRPVLNHFLNFAQ
jgi:hypothetical protein